MALTAVTIIGQVDLPDTDAAAKAIATFTPNAVAVNPGDRVVLQHATTVILEPDGTVPTDTILWATDDPGVLPDGLSYKMAIHYPDATTVPLYFNLPHTSPTFDISNAVPQAPPPSTVAFATQAALAAEMLNRAAADLLLIPLAQKAAANGVATLDAGSKIPVGQLPALAVSDFLGAVASQAAMLALVGQRGDWCIRTDMTPNHTFIVVGDDPTQLANWHDAGSFSLVNTVAGRVGDVVLAPADIGGFDAQVRTSRLDQMASPADDVSMNGHRVTSLQDPTAAQDAATRAYVLAQIASLVNSAPGVLDTLKELADALGDDANFAATMTTALAGKHDAVGPGLREVNATTVARAPSTTGFADLAALPAAATHNGEMMRTADGGIYESDGASWLVIHEPIGTWVSALRAAKTGLTDAAPAIQAAIDAGTTHLDLDPDGIYLLNTPIFIDNVDRNSKYVIECHGATIILGAALPTCPNFTPDATTKWAIFNNTLRAALAAGIVTAVGNRASPTGAASKNRLTFRNANVDGQGRNAGLCFGNECAATMDNVTLVSGRTLLSWTGYADGNRQIDCHNRTSTAVADNWLLYQIDEGDATVVDGGKAGVGSGVASLYQCRSAEIRNPIAGFYRFTDSYGIRVSTPHIEANQNTTSAFLIDNSHVDFDCGICHTGAAGAGGALGGALIEIADTFHDRKSSDVTIRALMVRTKLDPDLGDVQRAPELYITSANDATKIRTTFVIGAMTVRGNNSWLYGRTGPLIGSAVAGITNAITAARYLIASGSWELRKRSGAWEFVVPGTQGLTVSRKQGTPTALALSDVADGMVGTLVNGTTYEYCAALRDHAGNYAPVSAAVSLAAAANGALRLSMTVPTNPCTLVIWRKTGAGVLAGPDRFVTMRWDGYNANLIDTGANINGIPWVSAAVPVPNAVAASDKTYNALLMDTGVIWPDLFVYLAADSANVNNSTALVDTLLTLTTDPNAVYELLAVLRYEATATADLKVKFNCSTGSLYWGVDAPQAGMAAAGGGATSISRLARVETDTPTIGGNGTGAPVVAKPSGLLVVGSVAAVVTVQIAQGTAEVSNALLKQGSHMKLHRVA